MLQWFNAREATELGTALADRFAARAAGADARGRKAAPKAPSKALQEFLRRAEGEVRPLRLNFYKKARFANTFKWRLVEKGVEPELADEVTQTLILQLSLANGGAATGPGSAAAPTARSDARKAESLVAQGNACIARGAHAQAVVHYQEALKTYPRQAEARNNLGAAFCHLGRYTEALDQFRQAMAIEPEYAEAHNNLGNVLRWRGFFAEAESSLRRAVELKPDYLDASINRALTLAFLGRLQEARAQFQRVLKAAPSNADALFGMGHIAAAEGRFDEAQAMYARALEVRPNMAIAWAAQAGLRRMTRADGAWLTRAQQIAASGVAPLEEAELRFAMGKYCDDVGDFKEAFRNYQRANELQKAGAPAYNRAERVKFVDDMIRVYSRRAIATLEAGASASMKPVFVVGMMRSGTSLAEQIIASHPAAKGVGELGFWTKAVHDNEKLIRQAMPAWSLRRQLAEGYLRILSAQAADAVRVVDKATINSDYLGLIHSVFPNARIIYMRRDPIDTCLSCYFQKFSNALDFTMDLTDLAHYYREHRRLMAHWRAVLPAGTILDVPYAEMVTDLEGWTRRILDFLGLQWDQQCLNFHETRRAVVTASYWQVRQKIYGDSVGRWRNYRKYIVPLLRLKD
jgi:tetratricopeptide (TPR) repeat protein